MISHYLTRSTFRIGGGTRGRKVIEPGRRVTLKELGLTEERAQRLCESGLLAPVESSEDSVAIDSGVTQADETPDAESDESEPGERRRRRRS